MRRIVKITMVLTLMVMIINQTNAQQGQRNGQRQGQKNGQGQNFAQGLNLTDGQQGQMKTMRLNMQKEMLPIRNQLGENKAKLRTLTTAENVNTKEINKLIDASSNLRASMAKLQAANHQEVRKILTEEQRILFDSRDFRRSGRNGRHQKGERGSGWQTRD